MLIRTRLFQIPCYFKLKTSSLGFALRSFSPLISNSRHFNLFFCSNILFYFCSVRVERRNITRKIEARGIFPGAKVSRGPDWEAGIHDEGMFGQVTKITDWQGNPACAAEVSWESGTKGTYRLGYQGKVFS